MPAECHPHHTLPSGKDTRVHQSRADVGPALSPHSRPHNQELSCPFARGSEEPRGGANSVHFPLSNLLRVISSAHREQLEKDNALSPPACAFEGTVAGLSY